MWDHEGCGSSMCCKARPNQQGLPLKQFELTMQRRLWRLWCLWFEVEILLKEQSLIVKQREIISQLHNQVRQPGWHNIDTVWAIWEYVMIVASWFPLRNIARPKEIRKSFNQVATRSPWNMSDVPCGPCEVRSLQEEVQRSQRSEVPEEDLTAEREQCAQQLQVSTYCRWLSSGYPLVIRCKAQKEKSNPRKIVVNGCSIFFGLLHCFIYQIWMVWIINI